MKLRPDNVTHADASRSGPGVEPATRPSPWTILLAFGGLSATLAAGYGVLFTIVDDYKNEYGIDETAIGIVIGIGFLAGFVSQIVFAPYADRGYARTVVVVGVLVAVGGLLLMGFGTSLTPILLGRVINGLGIGAAAPAVRRIVIIADPQNLGSNLGRLLSADVFGFAMGPAISAVLVGPFGIPSPFIVVAVASLVLLPFAARVPAHETSADKRPQRRLAFDLLSNRAFAGTAVLAGVAFLMIGGFDALWSLVHDELGTAEWIANLGITLFALPLVFLGPLGGRLSQSIGPYKIAAIGLFAGGTLMLGYGLLPTGGLIFALAMVHAVNDGLTFSASGVAAGMVIAEDRQAGAQGILGAAQALMAGGMAVVTGYVYETFGRTVAYATIAAAIFVVTAFGLWLARDAWNIRREM